MKSSAAKRFLHALPSVVFLSRKISAFPKPFLQSQALVLDPCLADVLPHEVRLLCLHHEVGLGSNDVRRSAQVTAVWVVNITPRMRRRIGGVVHGIGILGRDL